MIIVLLQEVLAVLTSNRKEAFTSCRIQAREAIRKKSREVAGLRMQKEILGRALYLGCTVTAVIFNRYGRINTCLLLENTSYLS